MSEKNKIRGSKKWLISRLKTSGSKRKYVYSPDYADTRHAKSHCDIEDLPQQESMSRSQSYCGKFNTDLLKRFLRTQVGKSWDDIYAEIIQRIPTKLLAHKDCIYWYVADQVEIRDGEIWDLRKHYFIPSNTEAPYTFKPQYRYMEFYVDPETNTLMRIDEFKSRKRTRDLSKEALQAFREQEQKEKLKRKRNKNSSLEERQRLVQILKQRKQEIKPRIRSYYIAP